MRCLIQRGLAERHERDDIDRADARMLPVCVSMSMSWIAATSRSRASETEAAFAGDRQDGPVVARVARPIEQMDAATEVTAAHRSPNDIE